MHNRKQKRKQNESVEFNGHDFSFSKIMKDVENFSSSHMTWKERKELENRKVVALGGKPPKKQRLPLSVARVQMKKQQERGEKMLEQNMILGRFGGKLGGSAKRDVEKRRPENRVLKATEGHFRNGVLDVKHLLHSGPPKNENRGGSKRGNDDPFNNGMRKKGSGKKGGRGKKKGGGKKRK